ncbi:hypothetical protein HYH02_014903 [Chlamydomonas schloesseri]|uniref:Uncharacterized protein n=1 Tax=Chlamydomonas schloesseri TaxID=2026947 RepID=A0A835SER7_9CHLO|nr:hypothetical protein HYH02_014903 [Chlamydomonas schloesseri]|eukprot:KAG2425903.1 hypothetical protein HYH02_014903 [Chlamydomonas schloesseri]
MPLAAHVAAPAAGAAAAAAATGALRSRSVPLPAWGGGAQLAVPETVSAAATTMAAAGPLPPRPLAFGSPRTFNVADCHDVPQLQYAVLHLQQAYRQCQEKINEQHGEIGDLRQELTTVKRRKTTLEAAARQSILSMGQCRDSLAAGLAASVGGGGGRGDDGSGGGNGAVRRRGAGTVRQGGSAGGACRRSDNGSSGGGSGDTAAEQTVPDCYMERIELPVINSRYNSGGFAVPLVQLWRLMIEKSPFFWPPDMDAFVKGKNPGHLAERAPNTDAGAETAGRDTPAEGGTAPPQQAVAGEVAAGGMGQAQQTGAGAAAGAQEQPRPVSCLSNLSREISRQCGHEPTVLTREQAAALNRGAGQFAIKNAAKGSILMTAADVATILPRRFNGVSQWPSDLAAELVNAAALPRDKWRIN